jgi:hypothetical protein
MQTQPELNFETPFRRALDLVEHHAGFGIYRLANGLYVAGHDSRGYASRRAARASAIRQKTGTKAMRQVQLTLAA